MRSPCDTPRRFSRRATATAQRWPPPPAAALVTAPPATRPPSAPPRASPSSRVRRLPRAPPPTPSARRRSGGDRPSPPPAPAPAVPPAARAPRKLTSVAVVVFLVGLTAGASVWLPCAPRRRGPRRAPSPPPGRLEHLPSRPSRAADACAADAQEPAPVVATAPRAVQAPSALAPSAAPAPAAPTPAAPHRHRARGVADRPLKTPEPAPSPTPQSAFVVQ